MLILENWKEEKQAAYLYGIIARSEPDPIRKRLFLELAIAADKQATIWESKLERPAQTPALIYQPGFRTRLVGKVATLLGAKQSRFILSAMKVRGMSIYSGAPDAHAAGAHLEQRHSGINTAGNLRAAVFGVNDGLISNVSLLLGMAGANAEPRFIVLSGVAGLLAGAFSMAAGEYISVRSQREFFEYQIRLEKEELDLYPEEEAAELACIYRARGMPRDEAQSLANRIISDPVKALDTLAREELGLNPAELGSPVGAAISSFLSFAAGAFVPLLPYLISAHPAMVYFSIGLTAVALATIGGILSLFTNRSAVLSALRMLLIGCLAGGATFLIGKWLGVVMQ